MKKHESEPSFFIEIAHRFVKFCERYGHHFKTKTRSNELRAKQYMKGLIQAEKRNMEKMEEVVTDADEQTLQHFISNSGWEYESVFDQIGRDVDRVIGDKKDACLIIDESGHPKKGDKSVGVSRQWCGELGKVENCQVGVYAALAHGNYATLIDERLYLPKCWTDNEERCKKAGVPDEALEYKDKMQLALDLILTARDRKIRFGWVGLDGFYGQNILLLQHIEDAGQIFMADVHKDQHIYLEDPNPIVPERKSNLGQHPTKLVAQTKSIRVDKWISEQCEKDWQCIKLRNGTKGELIVEALHKRIWIWDGESDKAVQWHLIVRRELDSPRTIKYSLSNAHENTSLERLGFMQAQRYWVERSIQDGKREVGMGEYQVRGWKGWHHHMAMVMMAMLFMLEERLDNIKKYPLLSCADIQNLLAHFLPRRDVTVDEVILQMEKRHRKRHSAIKSAYKKQKMKAEARGDGNLTK